MDVAYTDGTAVHLDLSPRVTRFVSEFKEAHEQNLFLEMLERDAWTFFATLALCRSAKLVMIAGTATGKYCLNEFLQRIALNYGHTLDRPFVRRLHPESGKTAVHYLSGPTRRLPVFFCSSSPSDRDKAILVNRVRENLELLKRLVVRGLDPE